MTELARRSFVSVEQLEEVTRRLGWHTEYRQLEPGAYSSYVVELEGASWFLMGERSSRTVEVQAPAPAGMYVLALVEGYPGVMNGQSLCANHIFMLRPDADFSAVVPGGMKVTQVGIAGDRLEELADAVTPEWSPPLEGASLIATTPGRVEKARQAMNAALSAPPDEASMRDETVSAIVTELVAAMADQSSTVINRSLHSENARRALERAREYIEAHLSETIRVASICSYAGTTLRTLNRIFTQELGISPQEYVMVRRLNAVRRQLLVLDREQSARVTDVAMQHGFTHLGRFAGQYRRHFGEPPRQTLQTR